MFNVFTDFIITKVYSATTMYTIQNANKKIKKNRPNWGMVIKYEGETLYKTTHNTYVSNANTVILLPKGSSYEWYCTLSGHFTIVEIECAAKHDEPIPINITGNGEIVKMFKELEHVMFLKKSQYVLETMQMCYLIILKALKTDRNNSSYIPNSKKAQLAPALKYIYNNLSAHIKNDYLASLCQISTVYFRKLFFEVYNTSPIKFIHNLRIEKAAEILKSDYISITDIALSLGYNSVYEFSKDFKKHKGVSPSKF